MKLFILLNLIFFSAQSMGASIDCKLTLYTNKSEILLSEIKVPYDGGVQLLNSGDAIMLNEYAHEFQYTANISGPHVGLMMLHHLPTNNARFQTGMGPINTISIKVEDTNISFSCSILRKIVLENMTSLL